MSDEIEKLKNQKDNAYWERNQLIAALSKIFPAKIAKHDENDKDWDDDWRTIVVIELPLEATIYGKYKEGDLRSRFPDLVWHTRYLEEPSSEEFKYIQLSWHIHDSDIPMFDHLSYYTEDNPYWWDRHTTEQKYRRLRALEPRI